ncbi:hypothetical protein Tco_0462615 [Tanacetum coccineum]
MWLPLRKRLCRTTPGPGCEHQQFRDRMRLQAADRRRQTVISELLKADYRRQRQLVEALKIVKALKTPDESELARHNRGTEGDGSTTNGFEGGNRVFAQSNMHRGDQVKLCHLYSYGTALTRMFPEEDRQRLKGMAGGSLNPILNSVLWHLKPKYHAGGYEMATELMDGK